MYEMTVGKKIAGGFGLLVFLTALIGGISTMTMRTVSISVNDLSEVHLPLTVLTGKIAETALHQELAVNMYALHTDQEYLDQFKRYDAAEDGYFEELKELLLTDQELVDEGWLEEVNVMAKVHDEFVSSANHLIEFVNAGKQTGQELDRRADLMSAKAHVLNKAIGDFEDKNTVEAEHIGLEAHNKSSLAITLMPLISLGVLIIGVLCAWWITRSITKPLINAIAGLNDGSTQVAAASGQISSSSQVLAEGASEQAAGLEETSSSLEEMSSMSNQNSDNAGEATSLMNETNSVVEQAKESMNELAHAMEAIFQSSQNTSKIIKTIDEIAFQTNLLALNAAVEAARAGEAGAGFAVVADEVRNLAMRAAEAAKETSELIEDTVKKVSDGETLLASSTKTFVQVEGSSAKVGQLVQEIAGASKEQSEGVKQINSAVSEMDKVVQMNAANAEESASASEELSAQAECMKSIVQDIAAMVLGTSSLGNRTFAQSGLNARKERQFTDRKLIPMGENQFEDFSFEDVA